GYRNSKPSYVRVPSQARPNHDQAGDDPYQRLADVGVVRRVHHRFELRHGLLGQLALYQADTHPRELERQALRPTALDAGGRRLRWLGEDRCDATGLSFEAASPPAARRPDSPLQLADHRTLRL